MQILEPAGESGKCGCRLHKLRIETEMSEVIEPEIDVFGDESCRGRCIVFGALAVRSVDVANAEDALAKLKRDFGGTGESRLHCRVMFSGDQRKKSPWAHLNKSQVFDLYGKVAQLTREKGVRRLIAHADRARLPDTIPADDQFPRFKFGEKEVAAFCGNAIMIPFEQNPGFEKTRFWADPDRTKIEWLGKRRQAQKALSMFIKSGGRVSPQKILGGKPPLLEIADAIAYISARRLAGTKADLGAFRGLFEILEPEHIRFGRSPDGGLVMSVPNSSLVGLVS